VGLSLGAGFEVGGVAARVARHHALIEFDGSCGESIEDLAIVGDQEECDPETCAQVLLEPLDGVDIEVVRGFVEDG
jgi:hypothetical protein